MDIGERIKNLRNEKKITQKDLAHKLQVATTAVSAWERGANRPMVEKIAAMSEIFDVPFTYFFAEEMKNRNFGVFLYGERLRNLRKEKGWTQLEVARKVGVSKQTYSHYEKENRRPSLEMAYKLSEVYNVNINDVFGSDSVENSNNGDQLEEWMIEIINAQGSQKEAIKDMWEIVKKYS
ncbi:helix-turn-helix domain-containing protein [Alteribacter populi]|uniref:helix-turn-helix domain-containing protein n=1 Tax=Alteribacter populi TaxID=2011011 RepID=UPI001FDF36F2|nr:helix-turn-helix transcriptional regulator [Alteribacter populi]